MVTSVNYRESKFFGKDGHSLERLERVYNLTRESLLAETLREIDEEGFRVMAIISDGNGRVVVKAIKQTGEQEL